MAVRDSPIGQLLWLRRLAGALVRDDAAAEDLVQETWLVALRHPEAGHRPWLRRVLINLARMRGRSEARRGRREAASAPPTSGSASPEELTEQRRLLAFVCELPEPYRTVVLLRYFEGLSAAEIARSLDVPEGTVRWRLKEGLDRIRERLRSRRARQLVVGVLFMKKAFVAVVLVLGLLLLKLSTVPTEPAVPSPSRSPAGPKLSREAAATAPALVAAAAPSRLSANAQPSRECVVEVGGTVLDAAGGPIVGAHVETRTGSEAVTDQSGQYHLCLAPGQVAITASADGYGSLTARRSVQGPMVIDFAMAPEAVVVGKVVVEATMEPVPGAIVFMYPEQSAFTSFTPARRSTTTDVEGRFRIEGVAAGAHSVGAMAGDLSSGREHVALAPGQTSTALLIRVHPEPRVEGHVYEYGRPVSGARIVARGSGSPSRTGTSRADGSFELRLVPRGLVEFGVDGYVVDAPESLDVQSLVVSGARLEVHPATDTDVALPVDAPVAQGQLQITGTVVDPAGDPVPLVPVEAVGATGRAGTTSDMVGRFVMQGLTPGSYLLSATQPGIGRGTALSQGGDTGVTLRMLAPGRLTGSLQRFSRNVNVFAYLEGTPGDGFRLARQGGGRFLIDDLPPGRYILVAQSDDEGAAARADVEAGIVREVTLSAAGTAAVKGLLLASDGSPLPAWGCVVLPTLPDAIGIPGMEDWSVPAMTRADGSFAVARAPAGDVDVSCHSRGRPPSSAWIRLRLDAGRVAEIVVRASPPQ